MYSREVCPNPDETAEVMIMNSETRIRVMGILLMVPVIVCLATMTRAGAETLHISDGHNWSFIGEAWSDGEGGLISPPRTPWNTGASAYEGWRTTNEDVLMAFHTGRAYGDFEAEFKFRWDGPHCGAGFIFRAQDARHYYMAHFPKIGQVTRAENFWALISKVDDSGWVEVLKMERLHGVPADKRRWYTARLVVKGNEFRLWVDGRPMSPVHDDTYTEPGLVGFEAWAYAHDSSTFQDLRIRGKSVPPKPWDATLQPVQNWFLPYPVDAQQHCQGITQAPNGDLLLSIHPGGPVRSTDNGRTWAPVGVEGSAGGWIHTMRDGRLITLSHVDVEMSESKDNGKTWSKPEKVDRAPFVPPDHVPDMRFAGPDSYLELHDGTLLGFGCSNIPGYGHEGRFDTSEWGMYGSNSAWSIRSTDGGRTWSAPVPLNGPPATVQKYDLCEAHSNMQTKEGKVLSLVRPIYSPWMWEVWSDDNGKSWGPAVPGPFPCYAATALTTKSGVLLVSGRMPGLGLYVSHDSGMTWKPYRIDTAGLWGMGKMCEVAPDLVLYVYMDHYESSLRGQFIRITPDGAEPAREMLPIE